LAVSEILIVMDEENPHPLKIIIIILIAVGLFVLIAIYWPVAKVEIQYNSDQLAHVTYTVGFEQIDTFVKILTPPNTDFSIIIPKIDAIAPIIDNVDPNNQAEYLLALKTGVAHVLGSANPEEKGNVYLFAHADDAFYDVPGYNTVFFLLGNLTKGDEIYIFYRGSQIKYLVDQVKIITPAEVQYLQGSTDGKTLTIQTDYPPGMTSKRLIVTANQETTP
jgi:LPXTG-site transpeptidase (sortase) family protein